ncbi:MAG: hypothetical protein JKX87_06455 [Cycloclasticus sp.]|nr:hypothetical protein [Cycloclasticus sp.]
MNSNKHTYRAQITGALLISAALITPIASASNGLFALGYGARQVGIAGSGVAFPQDPLIAAINPAGVVFASERSEINLQYFSPSREYTVEGIIPAPPFPGPTVESDSENFFIPSAVKAGKYTDLKPKDIRILYDMAGMKRFDRKRPRR